MVIKGAGRTNGISARLSTPPRLSARVNIYRNTIQWIIKHVLNTCTVYCIIWSTEISIIMYTYMYLFSIRCSTCITQYIHTIIHTYNNTYIHTYIHVQSIHTCSSRCSVLSVIFVCLDALDELVGCLFRSFHSKRHHTTKPSSLPLGQLMLGMRWKTCNNNNGTEFVRVH